MMEANCVKCDCPLEQPVRMYGLACNYFDLAVCLCGDCHEWMLNNLDDACIMVYLDGEELKQMMTAEVEEEPQEED